MADAEKIARGLITRNKRAAGGKKKKKGDSVDMSGFVSGAFKLKRLMSEAGSDMSQKKEAARAYKKLRKKYGI